MNHQPNQSHHPQKVFQSQNQKSSTNKRSRLSQIPTPSEISKFFELEIDFEGKEENIPIFIHGLSQETKPEELREYLSSRCEFSSLVFKKKRTSNKRKRNLYQSIASFTVKDRKTASELIRRSGILKGRIVHCDIKYSSPKKMKAYQERRLFIGNLDQSWTDRVIFDNLANYGRIRAAYSVKKVKNGKSKGYGFADFYTTEDALRFLELGQSIRIEGQPILIQRYKKEKGGGKGSGGGSSNEKKDIKSDGVKQSPEGSSRANAGKISLLGNLEMTQGARLTKPSSQNDRSRLMDQLNYTGANPASIPKEKVGKMNVKFFSKKGSNESSNNQESDDKKRQMNLRLIGLALMNDNLFAVPKKESSFASVLSQAITVRNANKKIHDNYVLNSYDSRSDSFSKIIAEIGGLGYIIKPLKRKIPGNHKGNFKKKTLDKEAFMASKYSSRMGRGDFEGKLSSSGKKNVSKNTLKNRKRRRRKKKKEKEQRRLARLEESFSSNFYNDQKSHFFYDRSDFNSRIEHFDGHYYSLENIDRAQSNQFFGLKVRGSGRRPRGKSYSKTGLRDKRRWSHEE